MRRFITLMLITIGAAPAFAQWAVVDVANLKQSVANYAMMGQQLAKQGTQIANQIQQIQQFETQLKRLGDMSTIKKLVGFPEFRLDLNLPSKVRKWADELGKVDGRALFGDTRGGIYRQIDEAFTDFDGIKIERNPQIFKEAQDLTATVDEFKTVQSDVYTRREALKLAIARTSDALQNADTEAEEQKLSAILSAQYSQLSAVDNDVTLSAAEVQVKAAEATAMNDAQYDADAEARGRLAQQEVKKLSTVFKPKYECLLQYVSEQKLSP